MDNVTGSPDQYDGRAFPALSSRVHTLIFITVQAIAFLRVSPYKGHNRFVVARGVVDSLGLHFQGFLFLLQVAFEYHGDDGEDHDYWFGPDGSQFPFTRSYE